MTSTLMILQAVVAVILIVLVLIQFGKGAETGLMSSVGDTTMSGATKGNILTKITVVVSIVFLGNSLILARIESKKNVKSIMDTEAPIQRPLNSDAQNAMTATASAPATASEAVPAAQTATDSAPKK